jgi:glycerophosphoryl diester phosphodiesterase
MLRIIVVLIVITLSCSTAKQSKNEMPISKVFDTQGHRGCRGLMPENTIPAMLKALEDGVVTLEMDVVITKDKQVILSHEPFFNHEISIKANGLNVTEAEEKELNIYKMTYAETQLFDVGIKTHPRFPKQQKIKITKPLLADVIKESDAYANKLKRGLPFYNIETKTKESTDNIYHPAPTEFIELLVTTIKQNKIEERAIVQSFDSRTLQYLHKNYPYIKTALLIEPPTINGVEGHIKQLGFTPTIYSPAYQMVNQQMVNKCHAMGMLIIPWTVNDSDKIKSLKQLGVDGVISDYTNLYKN